MADQKKCNHCGETYPGNLSFCLNDGSPLIELDPMIGTVLDGRYRLESLIGEGGMGNVYRATHVHLDSEVAVKLLRPEFVADQTAIKRFRLEAKAAGRIHHPNAVKVTDFGVTNERVVYLTMELVRGQSLRSIIRKEGKLDYIRTVNIASQVCGAVEAAHRGGVIHRDLKPDNILIEGINNTERVKVLDFGIAKLRETKTDNFLTQAGTIIGTPQYMSPEQCQGKHLDPKSDIYSIGILIYEMLTGEVPFDGESTLQIVYNQLHVQPRPILELSPHVPVPIAEVIMRALEKEPERRQSSAIQLSAELRRAVEIIGESGSLIPADPLLSMPYNATGDISSINTNNEDSGQFPSQSEDWSSKPGGRKTSALAQKGSSADDQTTKLMGKRPTPHAGNVPTSERPAGSGPGTATETPANKSRTGLIVIAGIVLACVAGVIIYYFSQKTGPTDPVTQTTKAPEGMVYIPGGKFTMGRNDGSADEGPAHEVEVKPYFIDIHEVTNQDFKRFVEATGRSIPKNWKFNGSYPPDEARLPVTFVTWNDATSYARWANKRLATEAEWEYAARGGSKALLYPWGNQWQAGYANVDRKGQTKPSPVRSFEMDVSQFGVFDMAGNVSEWVQDYYTEKYGAAADQRFRVYRGGNFLDAPDKSTNTYRWADFPTEIPDDQILRVGFRCAKDVERQ
ncbi:MAG: SUMF1/EgtB/PvdO family nonheme iron enzyme [Acidobacteria bacterium]|nr:SUMF1/EgtB/PvdO family nonheme iron enzyme [Acidobacteriota bacterium]